MIRSATVQDLPGLRQLESRFPGDRLSSRQLRRHVQSSHARLRVAVGAEGRVVGYALLLLHAARAAARLYSIVVDPDCRGAGIGQALLGDAEAQARVAGRNAVVLEVRADNAPAIALYRRSGYVPYGQRRGYYEDGADALCLRKPLAACDA